MRLIDADELKEWVANWLKMDHYYHPYASCNDIPVNELEDIIERMPTVDAVPVVRCKDCKYYNPQQHYCEGIGNWFGCVGEWSDNGYCYKAERKEE